VLVSASALIVATCNGREVASIPPMTPIAPAAPTAALEPVVSASVASASAVPTAPPAAPTVASPRGPGHELDNFYGALRSLEKRARQTHVRVAWLGDSHGAADMWSGPLRAALQAKFGDGGPGFVHVGYKCGVLLAGSSDDPHATLTVADAQLSGKLLWDFCYKLGGAQDELQLGVTGLPDRVIKVAGGEAIGVLRHVSFTTSGASPALKVVPLGGQPGLCGVTIETDPATQPGVVLDTLGINGARLTTPLAWNETAWVAELARRPPSLVIVEYGTNESGDHTIHPEAFVENLRRLLARVRAASPNSDCLVLAPTDRADTEDRTPIVRDALRDAAKALACGFWDTYTVMGGKGSISAWRNETPPRAAGDGVHLNARGYKELGDQLAAYVLAGYAP
jgi:lysophospholipase L1-like esterase